MASNHKYKHLTLEDRIIIETGIRNGATKTSIAKTLGKDNSTIGKEIKKHRYQSAFCKMALECKAYKTCLHGRKCHLNCPDYIPFSCKRRDSSPGACNGCSNMRHCRFHKFRYSAAKAQAKYEADLVATRVGLDLDQEEVKRLAEIIVKPIKQGQSPYAIITNHPDIGISEKSLYNYIEQGVFREYGIIDLNLRQKVARKQHKKSKAITFKKRQNRKFLIGREYRDFQKFIADSSQEGEISIIEMDTIFNKQHGPFIQTFYFKKFKFLIAFLHQKKTAKTMSEGIDLLEEILSNELFEKYVQVILTDRGSEFSDPLAIEYRKDQTRRTFVFYCDPMSPGQKGTLEKKHADFRFIVPKGESFEKLGLVSQVQLNKALAHLNSYPTEACCGKTPWQLLLFLAPDMAAKFQQFGIEIIDKDLVTLSPNIFK